MPRSELCSQDFVICTRRVTILPNITDIKRMLDNPCAHFLAKETVQQLFIEGQCTLREDRIAEFLELFHDLVVETGIVVIYAAQHDNTDAIFTFKLVKRFTSLTPNL